TSRSAFACPAPPTSRPRLTQLHRRRFIAELLTRDSEPWQQAISVATHATKSQRETSHSALKSRSFTRRPVPVPHAQPASARPHGKGFASSCRDPTHQSRSTDTALRQARRAERQP